MRILLAILLLLGAMFSFGQELTEEQRQKADEVRERTLNEIEKLFPGVSAAAMIDFYEQNSSDTLHEWRLRCIYKPETAQDYLNSLAKRYVVIESMRKKSPEYYNYNVEQLRMEMEIRKLSYAIKTFQKQGDNAKVQELTLALENLLKTSFDKAQEMEFKNMKKMEAQLNELKVQIQKRAANRDIIIQQKLKLLTEGN